MDDSTRWYYYVVYLYLYGYVLYCICTSQVSDTDAALRWALARPKSHVIVAEKPSLLAPQNGMG